MKQTLKLICTGMLLLWSALALANGKITHLSGPVSLKKADGSTAQAAPGSIISQGDTLVTGPNGFVRMETPDGGEFVLRPDSEFVMEKYSFDKDKPQEDSFVYNMVKGGLRTVTGLIGKRGNRDAYMGKTPTATIGIRGTAFQVRVCGECGAGVPKGTYFSVTSGSVSIGGAGASSVTMTPGVFVFVPPGGAPQTLPADPGLGFTAPANIPTGNDNAPPSDGGTPGNATPEVNCVIS